MNRRFFLRSSGLALAAFGCPTGFLRRALAESPSPVRSGKVLVTLFLRGAADGLSLVAPTFESRYAALRPNLALKRAGQDGGVLPLEGGFGLHPALAALHPLYREGSLGIVHAVGSPHATRSHFDAQDFLESGTPGVKSTRDGWLNRALSVTRGEGSPFRAVAFAPTLPRSLAGEAPAVALSSLSDFDLRAGQQGAGASTSFESLYGDAVDAALKNAGAETFEALRTLRGKGVPSLPVANGAVYPASPLGRRFREIAQLVRGDVGLEAAFTDASGWDTHAGQGAAQGQLANRLLDLGNTLAAFAKDLGPRLADVCVVVMTEFGRTVRENGTRGTDHGHGSVLFALGGSVAGGRVHGRWPGLSDANLFEGRDLAVTTDLRDVLAEVLLRHLGIASPRVFPGHTAVRIGLMT